MNGTLQRRPGTTLLETVTVIGVLAVVLAGSVVAIGAMYRVERLVNDRHDHDRAVARAAEQFRIDAHAAAGAELAPGPAPSAALRLVLPDARTIDYSIDDYGISRVVSRGGEAIHREGYLFPALAEARISLRSEWASGWSRPDPDGRLITLAIPAAPAASDDSDPRMLRIDAAVGLDLQYSDGEQGP